MAVVASESGAFGIQTAGGGRWLWLLLSPEHSGDLQEHLQQNQCQSFYPGCSFGVQKGAGMYPGVLPSTSDHPDQDAPKLIF